MLLKVAIVSVEINRENYSFSSAQFEHIFPSSGRTHFKVLEESTWKNQRFTGYELFSKLSALLQDILVPVFQEKFLVLIELIFWTFLFLCKWKRERADLVTASRNIVWMSDLYFFFCMEPAVVKRKVKERLCCFKTVLDFYSSDLFRKCANWHLCDSMWSYVYWKYNCRKLPFYYHTQRNKQVI